MGLAVILLSKNKRTYYLLQSGVFKSVCHPKVYIILKIFSGARSESDLVMQGLVYALSRSGVIMHGREGDKAKTLLFVLVLARHNNVGGPRVVAPLLWFRLCLCVNMISSF